MDGITLTLGRKFTDSLQVFELQRVIPIVMNRIPAIAALSLLAVSGPLAVATPEEADRPQTAPQKDPRGWPYTSVRFNNGEDPAKGDYGAYVIIAWANPPAGTDRRGYQIWGDNRILTQKAVTDAITVILKKRPLDLIMVGNEWGAGSELDPVLRNLSKQHHIRVLGGSTFGFDNVDFNEESEELRQLISTAIDQTNNAQQDGADQPATAPESKAEGKGKAKPESEVRPQ